MWKFLREQTTSPQPNDLLTTLTQPQPSRTTTSPPSTNIPTYGASAQHVHSSNPLNSHPTMCYNIFGYDPNVPLAIAAATVWGVLSTIMLFQTIRGRNGYFLIVPISGLGMQTAVHRTSYYIFNYHTPHTPPTPHTPHTPPPPTPPTPTLHPAS
jgi:hypothetical protein